MKTPKGIWFDSGVAAFLMGIADKEQAIQQQRWGALFETWVVNELRAACSLHPELSNLYHWRTQTQLEVDIVLEGKGRLLPIECKSGSTLRPEISSGMSAFMSTFKTESPFGLVIYGGDDLQLLGGNVVAVPAAFL